MFTRKEIKKRINKTINNQDLILGVAAGSGISARYAEEGGAELIMVLNAGIFRMAGVSSTACLLPFANANKLVMEVGKNRILPQINKTPVIFGMCATDKTIDKEEYLEEIIKAGFSGVTNFPSVGMIDGLLRNHLQENNLYYDCEVKLIARAVKKGIFTTAFVFNEQQAIKMAQVGPDIICINFGWTKGGIEAPQRDDSLDSVVNKTKGIYNSIKKIDPNMIIMVYGGPINSPEAANYLFKKTKISGYVGGSVFERIPLEKEIKKITQQYKMFTSLKRSRSKRLRQELRKKKSFGQLIGKSKAMQEVYNIIDQVADKKVNILLTGESGTGKELVARAIHHYGKFSNAPFVPINMASIPYNLLESELFGHEKGAYTGAHNKKKGKFEIANGGTLFLDEISDMPPALQAKLLRAIQEEKIQRLGAENTREIDVRIIAATNKNLKTLIKNNKFRKDLYYRLNVININLPPLRNKKEDIPLLIEEFISENNEKYDLEIEDVSSNFLNNVLEYDWPGNVRELKNVIERACILNEAEKKYLTVESLPPHIRKTGKADIPPEDEKEIKKQGLKNQLSIFEEKIIKDSLEDNDYNITQTAEKLNITRKTLRRKINKYKIQTPGN